MLICPRKAVATKGYGKQKTGNDDLDTRLMLSYTGKAVAKKGKESGKRVTMT